MGLQVALLDAGPSQKDANFTEHLAPFQVKCRNMAPEIILKTRPIQGQFYECSEANYVWFANDPEEAFTAHPGKLFIWGGWLRIGSGRTKVWGRLSLHYSDLNFKAALFDGFGVDWPLGYKNLAPYYDIVERYMDTVGQTEGNPVVPDGVYQPSMALTCAEARFRERLKAKMGRTVTPGTSLTGNILPGPALTGPTGHGESTDPVFTASRTDPTANCPLAAAHTRAAGVRVSTETHRDSVKPTSWTSAKH